MEPTRTRPARSERGGMTRLGDIVELDEADEGPASLGTLGVVSRPLTVYGSLTTPDPIESHRTLDRLAGAGVTHLAMEASSHGLDQKRLDGVHLAAGAFTNLSRDHMDYHPTVEH